MKQINILIVSLSIILISSCSKSTSENSDEIKIAYGLEGGRCVGFDSLSISQNGSFYYRNKPCTSPSITYIQASTTLTTTMEIYKSLEVEKFNQINVNTCARCADGIDYWMSVTTPSSYHKIFFSSTDTTSLSPILPVINLLNEEIKKYR